MNKSDRLYKSTSKAIGAVAAAALLLAAIPVAAVADSSGEAWFQFARLPEPVRTIHVTHTLEFRAAVAEAEPGDHIVLADGNYAAPEGATMVRDGTPSDPIVVRAENLLGARVVNMAGSFQIGGSHFILYGLDFVNTPVNVGLNRQTDNVMIWRCRFRDNPPPSTQISLRLYASRNADIAYNEWVNWAGRGISTGIYAGARDFTIRRNLFRDQPMHRINSTEAIQLGFGTADFHIDSGGVVKYNRFVDWVNDDEIISVKTSNTWIYRNSFEDCMGSVSNRAGDHNRYEANEKRDCWGFFNLGGYNLYLGNAQFISDSPKHSSGFRAVTDIKPGTVSADVRGLPAGMTQGGIRHASEGVVISGNVLDGGIRVGHPWSSDIHPVRNLRVRANISSGISFDDGWVEASGMDIEPDEPETEYSWMDRVWLEDQDVGPFADLTDKGPEGAFLGFPLDEHGWADTGRFMGLVYAEFAPWVYSHALARWLYAPGEAGDGDGVWFWVFP